MDFWLKAIDIEFIRWCPYVAFLIPVGSGHSKKVSNKHVMPDIKFSVVVKKRSIDIHLNDKGSFLCLLTFLKMRFRLIFAAWRAIVCGWSFRFLFGLIRIFIILFHDVIKLVNLINNCDSSAPVRILAWFNYPNISSFLFSLVSFFLLFFLFFY